MDHTINETYETTETYEPTEPTETTETFKRPEPTDIEYIHKYLESIGYARKE